MDHLTYQKIRTYCWHDLAIYIDTPNNNLSLELAGDSLFARIEHEYKIAMGLLQMDDLTPQENAAAYLLAKISNARMHAWQREPRPPAGNEPAPPLEKWQAEELAQHTETAVREYAVFLPEREAAALIACTSAMKTASADPAARPWTPEEIEEMRNKYGELGSYQKVADEYKISRQRVMELLKKQQATEPVISSGMKQSPQEIVAAWGLKK